MGNINIKSMFFPVHFTREVGRRDKNTLEILTIEMLGDEDIAKGE
jgi:hypothetical protein